MNIQQTHVSFTARNPEIRFADDIARRINKTYPRISSTIVTDFNNLEKHPDVELRIANKIYEFREQQDKLVRKALSFNNLNYKKISEIVTSLTKKFKAGNCIESTNLSLIAAKANNLKNISAAYIKHPNGTDYDHAVVLVNKDSKKPYVIDSWLGFADYVPNAIKRYQKEYSKYFDFGVMPSNAMIIEADEWQMLSYTLNHNRAQRVTKNLKKMFPELVIKKDP